MKTPAVSRERESRVPTYHGRPLKKEALFGGKKGKVDGLCLEAEKGRNKNFLYPEEGGGLGGAKEVIGIKTCLPSAFMVRKPDPSDPREGQAYCTFRPFPVRGERSPTGKNSLLWVGGFPVINPYVLALLRPQGGEKKKLLIVPPKEGGRKGPNFPVDFWKGRVPHNVTSAAKERERWRPSVC